MEGFHDLPVPIRIYVANEKQGGKSYAWYVLGDNAEKEVIKYGAITGTITDILTKEVEVKVSTKLTDKKQKLDVSLNVGDQLYIIRSGVETTFSKVLALSLSKLSERELAGKVSIAATPSTDNEKVVFCKVLSEGKPVNIDWKTEWNNPDKPLIVPDLVSSIQSKINALDSVNMGLDDGIPPEVLEGSPF